MCSATWPQEVQRLAKKYLADPVKIQVGSLGLFANENITQIVKVVPNHSKLDQMLELLHELYQQYEENLERLKLLIFTNTKAGASYLEDTLSRMQCPAACIHGDKDQRERQEIFDNFKSNRVPILIATDVVARGIDVSDISHVINYDFPKTIEDYVHRIGRTARAGATGTAHSFFTKEDFAKAQDLIGILEVSN